VSVLPLPRLHFDRLTDDQLELLPRFSKALGLAVGVGGRPRDLDLRRGDLTLQRDYGFLKEKIPLLSGLAAAIVISFFFSAWAESLALEREAEQLQVQLAARTNQVFGEPIDDPDEVMSRLGVAKKATAEDPMPHMDAFDVINAISEAIPSEVTHDIEEFDMVRNQVKLRGIVSSTEEAQGVLNTIEDHRCFEAAKIGKITQVVNSSQQKYALEFEVSCPEDSKSKSKKKKADGGAK
jgi:general secretion pathway protein L